MSLHASQSLKCAYENALNEGGGFLASNITHPDILAGLLEGAETVGSALLIQIKRDSIEYFGRGDIEAGLTAVSGYLGALASTTPIDLYLNIDHIEWTDEDLLQAVLDAGVADSVMIDASSLDFDDNAERTREVVEQVRSVSPETYVEAELGVIAGTESGKTINEALYTKPHEAVEFVRRTGCDLLAVSIGTEHGVTKGANLDLRVDLADAIGQALENAGLRIPLVIHGSTGLSASQLRSLMQTDVCKLNVNTRYQYEYARAITEHLTERSELIIPPVGVADDVNTMFADSNWQPSKSSFNTHHLSSVGQKSVAAAYAQMVASLDEESFE